jgi:hypothetical protein
MNTDKRRLKTSDLSAFICFYRRPICLFPQLAGEELRPGGPAVTEFPWGAAPASPKPSASTVAAL